MFMSIILGTWLHISWLTIIDCSVVDLSSLKTYIINQHNIFRRSEYAANMIKLTWDETLAREASYLTEKCQFKHMRSGFGENLYFDNYNKSSKDLVINALNSWYNERTKWQISKENCGTACHYTQMIWANTTTVGCAVSQCKVMNDHGRSIQDTSLMACYYYPKGNMYGSYPFQIGPMCSQCPNNTDCKNNMCAERIPTMIKPTATMTKRTQSPITSSTKITPLTTSTPSQPTTTSIKTTTYSICVDRLRGCQNWKPSCDRNHAVRISCPKTCERCNPPAFIIASPATVICNDDGKYAKVCPSWAKMGFCSKNQLMRDVYCQKTCGSCK